ncbi:hypothetical protein BD410DRAFT_756245 [Rickenella mellea]|uniref:BTB domain-containing protein n=1 Tax=Rickenella mellea TaxID=50990 RepID=A0A4Y7PJL2_9AGAM|nr:hypothetical protein BD410DRAFT_756245 [Rickenella mellea]
MNETARNTYIPLSCRKKHPKLWFDDGNIILATKLSLFRVHRSLLSAYSPVFADMLSLPQPEVAENTIDGLPDVHVVVFSDDDNEFTHFLRFCYNPRYHQGGMPTTFDIISGLLRMSTKYQVDELRDEVISHLALAYPSTFTKYAEAVKPNAQLTLFPPFDGQHFAVARLARETEATILLPVALWRSSCQLRQEIMARERSVSTREIDRQRLTPADERTCLSVQLACHAIYMWLSHELLSILGRTCPGSRADNAKCTDIALRAMAKHFSSSFDSQSVDVLQRWDSCDVWTDLVCDRCRWNAAFKVLRFKRSIWDGLPGRFGLRPWGGLVPESTPATT